MTALLQVSIQALWEQYGASKRFDTADSGQLPIPDNRETELVCHKPSDAVGAVQKFARIFGHNASYPPLQEYPIYAPTSVDIPVVSASLLKENQDTYLATTSSFDMGQGEIPLDFLDLPANNDMDNDAWLFDMPDCNSIFDTTGDMLNVDYGSNALELSTEIRIDTSWSKKEDEASGGAYPILETEDPFVPFGDDSNMLGDQFFNGSYGLEDLIDGWQDIGTTAAMDQSVARNHQCFSDPQSDSLPSVNTAIGNDFSTVAESDSCMSVVTLLEQGAVSEISNSVTVLQSLLQSLESVKSVTPELLEQVQSVDAPVPLTMSLDFKNAATLGDEDGEIPGLVSKFEVVPKDSPKGVTKPGISSSRTSKQKSTILFGRHESEIMAKLQSYTKLEEQSIRSRLVSMPVDEFNRLLEMSHLTEIEIAFMKEWRRRGKNKTAAQTARKRKREEMGELDIETEQLRSQHTALLEKYNTLKAKVSLYKDKTLKLESELFAQHSSSVEIHMLGRKMDILPQPFGVAV